MWVDMKDADTHVSKSDPKVELSKSVLGVPVSIQKILGKKSKAGERDCALDIKEPIN